MYKEIFSFLEVYLLYDAIKCSATKLCKNVSFHPVAERKLLFSFWRVDNSHMFLYSAV